jgi:uncharacterized membrane protein YqgA involved in biofilm formation
MTSFGLVILFVIIIALQVPKLIKQRMWNDLYAFSGLLLLAMVLSFAQVLDVPVLNPFDILAKIFTPVTNYLDNLVQSGLK